MICNRTSDDATHVGENFDARDPPAHVEVAERGHPVALLLPSVRLDKASVLSDDTKLGYGRADSLEVGDTSSREQVDDRVGVGRDRLEELNNVGGHVEALLAPLHRVSGPH